VRVAAGDQGERDPREAMHPAVYADGPGSIYSRSLVLDALSGW
jgi:hypothetical protein